MSLSNPYFRAADPSAHDGAALDAARQRVVSLLTDRYADDTLTIEEFEARLEKLHSARTVAELDVLMRDLTVRSGGGLASPQTPGAPSANTYYHPDASRVGTTPVGRVAAMLSEATRTGPWVLPQRLEVKVVLGDLLLDLRDAVLPPGGCEIDVLCVLGNFKILVPPGIVVDDGVTPMVSSVRNEAEHSSERAYHASRVRLTGTAVMSEILVRVTSSGERAKRAWQLAKPKKQRK